MKTAGQGSEADARSHVSCGPGGLPESIARRVEEVYAACRERYPTIDLPLEVFLRRVREVLGTGGEAKKSADESWDCRLADFERLAHGDLFLALACSCGDRIAWEYFADEYLSALRGLAVRACGSIEEGEDLAQGLMAGMLAESTAVQDGGDSAGRGRLGSYSGRGSLLGWLRVVVAHAAIDRMRRARRETSLEEARDRGPGAGAERGKPAEESSADARWGQLLAAVLAGQIRRLPARDRLLLALYYVQEVPLGRIGCLFGVHEATVSRRLGRLRRTIRKNVERECRRRHGLKPRDVEQLWRWVALEAELPLPELLSSGEAAGQADANKSQGPAGGSS